MQVFSVDKKLYHCPSVNEGVVIVLYYIKEKGEKIYMSIDCENKMKCGTVSSHDDLIPPSCPAFIHFMERGEDT